MANLTQLKLLENLDGFLLVDKPEGIAFSTVVKTVKRKFNLVKVGHGGSLDTMASGLFILLINDANKFVDRVMSADREWIGNIRLGVKTDTGDVNGGIIAENVPLADLSEFKGDIFQTEPRYSAIRREGSADYEVVCTGDHAQFLTHIYCFKLDATSGDFELKASKSLIVRALANDIGGSLKTFRRVRIGRFDVKDAIPLRDLLEIEMKDFASCVMPLSKALL